MVDEVPKALSTWDVTMPSYDGVEKRVYRKGDGPGVLVIHEVPGITPLVADFADRVVHRGFTVFLPSLFGHDGKPQTAAYAMSSLVRACVSKEFSCLATNSPSPITTWLRRLARDMHSELGGPGVGVVGMCLTGGFALAMMVDDSIAAPVLSQPANPLPLGPRRRRSMALSEDDWATVQRRVQAGCPVLGLRFTADPAVPNARFAELRERLGDGFIAVEIDSTPGNPHGIRRSAHSVLTEHLVDEPSHPTRQALERVLAFFDERLHF